MKKDKSGQAEKKSGVWLFLRGVWRGWYLWLIALFFVCAIALTAVCGENAQIAVHDNLDLFQAQYQMMKNTDTFFAHGVAAPFLGGVTRDDLPSELSFAGIIYFLFPSLAAYWIVYFSSILMAMVSFTLLAGEILGKTGRSGLTIVENGVTGADEQGAAAREGGGWRGLALLLGFAYGTLAVFPAFRMCFASVPLLVWMLLRLHRTGAACAAAFPADRRRARRETALLLLGIFVYPFFSYFSYFGLFLCGYLLLAVLWVSVRERRFAGRLFAGLCLLALGSVCFEYRLFAQMLLSDTATIRETFVAGDLTGAQIWAQIADVWKNGMMHAEDAHASLVLPVCVLYFWYRNLRLLARGQWKKMFRDLYNLLMALLLFNCVVYGLYNFGPLRTAVETALPPLKGWQFNRTVFFNPLLWYGAFALVCVRIYRKGWGMTAAARKNSTERGNGAEQGTCMSYGNRTDKATCGARLRGILFRAGAYALALAAVAVVLLAPSRYNDLYHTARAAAVELLTGQKQDSLSYGEFYSTALFEKIKRDLQYEAGNFAQSDDRETIHLTAQKDSTGAQWAVAYGLHPAVLEYNGIATLDGYLGFYAQSYKDAFREAIAPALERMPATRGYYDEWGARCYLYSGSEDTIVQATRRYAPADTAIYIDGGALRALGCRYVFSRIELSNAAAQGMTLRGVYTEESSPYTIYVYEM